MDFIHSFIQLANFSSFSILQGGEVVQETITSNINDDLITLEFQRTDGTLITQLIDFRNVSIKDVIFHIIHSIIYKIEFRYCILYGK